MEDLTQDQRAGLQQNVQMIRALRVIPSVAKHETRIEHEVALAASRDALDAIIALVEKHLGPPRKAAGEPVPTEIGDSAMVTALGGLRANQTLYTKALGDGLNVYVAFWPWGSGKRLTIKIGVHAGE